MRYYRDYTEILQEIGHNEGARTLAGREDVWYNGHNNNHALPEGTRMIQLSNLVLPVGGNEAQLLRKAARKLNLSPRDIVEMTLLRQSVDARHKNDPRLICTVALTVRREEEVLRRCPQARPYAPTVYVQPQSRRKWDNPPVVVGMGPAGLFAALVLARGGAAPIVLERGRPVEQRTEDVARFWSTGSLDSASNVQFGEGGAGTFSDGKLTTGIRDPRIAMVMDTLVAHGAPEDIRWSHKPHIGTDVLRQVVVSIRRELQALGCRVCFEHQLTGLNQRDGKLESIRVQGPGGPLELPCDTLILAPGHSARDTFRMLLAAGVPLEQKAFAVGVRIEHRQRDISLAQYGPRWDQLPPSDYKLACHLPNGRSAFTFCVCPGGQVVAAASEEGRLVTNGMSLRARDGENINGGLLVGVGPGDFGGSHPLAGMEYQMRLEEAAFAAGGGDFRAPAQLVGDFLDGLPSKGPAGVEPTYRPGVTWTDLRRCLPAPVADTLGQALPLLDGKLHGFAARDSVLTGTESRSSSPVRVLRGEDFQSALRGLYPCGEGAGYAGGITSAAVDGVKVAEAALAGTAV